MIPVALVVGLVIAGIAYVVYRSKMKRDRQQQQQGPGTVRREHRQSDAVMPESSSPPPPSSPSGYEPNSDTARVDSRQAAAAVVERPIDEVGDDDGEVNPSPSIEVDLNSDEERAGVTSSPVTSPPISRPVSRQSSSHGAIPIPADELEEGDPPRLGSDAPSVPTPSQESESSSSDADPVEGTSPRVRKVKSGAKKGSSRRRRKSVKPVVVEPPVQPIPYIDSLRPSGSRLDAVISPMFVADLLKNPDFKFTSASPTQPPPQASPATVLKHRKLKPSRLQSDRRSPSPRRSKSPRAPILVNSLPKAALEEDSMDSAFGLGLNQ